MKKLLLILPILLIACTTPNSPAQAVYAAESDYAVALRIELAYSNLPRCNKTASKLCSDVAVMKTVQSADDIAYAALKEAEIAVRADSFGKESSATAIASAKALVQTFVDITRTLKIK